MLFGYIAPLLVVGRSKHPAFGQSPPPVEPCSPPPLLLPPSCDGSGRTGGSDGVSVLLAGFFFFFGLGCHHSRTRRYGYFLYRESKEIRRFGRCLFLLFGFNSFILNLFAFLLIAATFAAHESKEICVVVGYRLGWWMARNCASTLPHCPWASMCCASAATRPSSRRDSRRQTALLSEGETKRKFCLSLFILLSS